MSRPMQRDGWADQVFDLIPVNTTPIPGKDLASAANLSVPQVRLAVAYLRDQYPDFPLVSSRQGYVFTIDGEQVARFRTWRQRSALTTMRRLWTGVISPYIKQTVPDPFSAAMMERQYARLLEDLDALG